MVEDLDHLVGQPYEQARRTFKYLQQSTPAVLECEDGRVAATIDLAPIRKMYIINVTLADIGHVSARLSSARAMGLVDGVTWPWSVHINDLRVISELIQSPAEFLLYLNRRLALNDLTAVSSVDELDYLGMFLKNGLYFKPDELAEVDRFTPIGYTVPIERYFDFQAGRVSSGEKPSLNISTWLRTLVRMLESTAKRGAFYVAELLLSLDGTKHEQIERWFKAYSRSAAAEPRSFTLLSKSGLPTLVLSISSPEAPQHDPLMQHYVSMKRLHTNGHPLVWISIDQTFQSADFRVLDGPIEKPDPKQQAELMALQRGKYESHVRAAGQPGRNESCPCSSGEKFKRCCLQYVEAWNAAKRQGR